MKVSVCITVFNEEKSISKLLESLLSQTKKPDEIVIVDGGSTDKTVEIIRHFQKKNKRIKLLVKKCARSRGRNLSAGLAKNEIIAITDADCVADKNWLKRIIEPFKNKQIGIAAGFYKMTTNTAFQKAESVFLGVVPSKFDIDFLPSTRSIAFSKSVWEKVGGFPETGDNSAEDTDFNYKALKMGVKFARVKNAWVEWGIPVTYKSYFKKVYAYAKWDVKYGIWWHPVQRYASHNIKAVLKIIRYAAGFMLFLLGFMYPLLWVFLVLGLLFYIFWAFRKVYSLTNDYKAGFWGIVIQFSSDFAVMAGFISGLLNISNK